MLVMAALRDSRLMILGRVKYITVDGSYSQLKKLLDEFTLLAGGQ